MHLQGDIHKLRGASDKRNKRSLGGLQIPCRLADSDTRSAFRRPFDLQTIYG